MPGVLPQEVLRQFEAVPAGAGVLAGLERGAPLVAKPGQRPRALRRHFPLVVQVRLEVGHEVEAAGAPQRLGRLRAHARVLVAERAERVVRRAFVHADHADRPPRRRADQRVGVARPLHQRDARAGATHQRENLGNHAALVRRLRPEGHDRRRHGRADPAQRLHQPRLLMPRLFADAGEQRLHGSDVADRAERVHRGGADFVVGIVQHPDQRRHGLPVPHETKRQRGPRPRRPRATHQAATPRVEQPQRTGYLARPFDGRALHHPQRFQQRVGDDRAMAPGGAAKRGERGVTIAAFLAVRDLQQRQVAGAQACPPPARGVPHEALNDHDDQQPQDAHAGDDQGGNQEIAQLVRQALHPATATGDRCVPAVPGG